MRKRTFTGIWNKFELIPPPVVRLLACDRKPGNAAALTDQEIAERSGLTVTRVQEIYWEKTWDAVPLGEVKRFFEGCGYNLDNHRHVERLARNLKDDSQFKWRHLHRSKHHKMFQKLLQFAIDG